MPRAVLKLINCRLPIRAASYAYATTGQQKLELKSESSGCNKKLLTRNDLQCNGGKEGTYVRGQTIKLPLLTVINEPFLELSITTQRLGRLYRR